MEASPTTTEVYQQGFAESSEKLSPTDIYVIEPDEYSLLADISAEEAKDLPDGLYVVGETTRDYLLSAGMTVDNLTQAITFDMQAKTGDPKIDGKLPLGRESSAHKVFFGLAEIESSKKDGTQHAEATRLIAVKTHPERYDPPVKPFRELGNLALLQSLGQEGIYRPIGVLQDGDHRYVLTERRPEVRTLDDHSFYGDKASRTNGKTMSHEEIQQAHERDTELVGRVFDLLGRLHAQGIFHGDAQRKNMGWSPVVGAIEQQFDRGVRLDGAEDLKHIAMTIVDLENTKVFKPDSNGDFSAEYYEQVLELGKTDVFKFFNSVPRKSRLPLKPLKQLNEETQIEYIKQNFTSRYLKAFAEQRRELLGQQADQAVTEALGAALSKAVEDYIKDSSKSRATRSGKTS